MAVDGRSALAGAEVGKAEAPVIGSESPQLKAQLRLDVNPVCIVGCANCFKGLVDIAASEKVAEAALKLQKTHRLISRYGVLADRARS